MSGLYIHIPFCFAICNYCNFNRGLFDAALKARYLDALIAEIEGGDRTPAAPGEDVGHDLHSAFAADTIYFGGGTPTVLPPEALCRLVERARSLFGGTDDLEVTVDSVSDDRGLLGLDESVPAGPLSGRVAVRITAAGVDPGTLEEVAQWGVKHCPVCDALERAVPVTTEVATD